jgi:hypothetical protein
VDALYTPECAVTRRLDGSYTVAISNSGVLEFTPQGLRYARQFLPMFFRRIKAIEFGLGASLFNGPEALGSWEFDKTSPFERIRVLDPAPNRKMVERTMVRVPFHKRPFVKGYEIVRYSA